MQTGARLISWGLFFIIFDFHLSEVLGGHDIFADALGYGLVLAGLHQVRGMHRRFGLAVPAAGVGLACSLVSYGELSLVVSVVVDLCLIAAELFAVWQIATGVAELADKSNDMVLAKRARSRRNAFVIIPMLAAVVLSAAFVELEVGGILLLPAGLYSLVVSILIIGLMRRAAVQLAKSVPTE